ncbi:MAG: hypothetical protein FJ128_00795 [Deltaproteobacteria bacterium]|nr:hypothetical protein [Deltaproteobacteria bacterium]
MDLFTVLEQKLEMVLHQMEGLQRANAELKQALAQREQVLAEMAPRLQEAEATVEKVTREREAIRQRIDKILDRLKILDLGETV